MKTYTIDKDEKDQQYIKCLVCGKKSYNFNDITKKYCGNCNNFHRLLEIKNTIKFCKKCGEYITDSGECSNPFCPMEMK